MTVTARPTRVFPTRLRVVGADLMPERFQYQRLDVRAHGSKGSPMITAWPPTSPCRPKPSPKTLKILAQTTSRETSSAVVLAEDLIGASQQALKINRTGALVR